MIGTRWLAGLATVVLGCAAVIAAQDRQGSAAAQKPLALVGGMLIDGAGGPPIRNSVVLIRGDRIEKVGFLSLPVPGAVTTRFDGRHDDVDGRGPAGARARHRSGLVIRRCPPTRRVLHGRRARHRHDQRRRFADVIAVRGDPLRHIEALREPKVGDQAWAPVEVGEVPKKLGTRNQDLGIGNWELRPTSLIRGRGRSSTRPGSAPSIPAALARLTSAT